MNSAITSVASGLAQLAVEFVGTGTPVVFLHAGVADRRMWREQLEALSQQDGKYRAVAYDRRGYGDTLHVEERYAQVDDLLCLFDAVAPGGRTILVGCSQGGRIAIDTALAHPGRVAALVLIAPAISGAPQVTAFPPAIQAWIDKVEAAETVLDVDRVNALEAHAWLDGPLAPERRVTGAARELFLAMNEIALRAERRGTEIEPAPAYPRLHELDLPVLVVWGEHDFPHIAQSCADLAARLPHARVLKMRDAAHLPNLEHPAEFNRDLLEFLDSVGG